MAFVKASLPRNHTFDWVTYQYRYYSEDAVDRFGCWLAGKDWDDVLQVSGSNNKVEAYQRAVTSAMEEAFYWD